MNDPHEARSRPPGAAAANRRGARWPALAALLAGLAPAAAAAQPTPLGSLFQVNTYTTGSQFVPVVAKDAAGAFVVAWTSGGLYPGTDPQQDGSGFGVFARRFDAAGNPVSGEIQVATTTAGHQHSPAVAAAPGGAFVVVWNSDGAVRGQRFDGAGSPQGGEFRVDDPVHRAEEPAIAADPAGNFVVAWTEYGAGHPLKLRRFAASGAPLDEEVVVAELPFSPFYGPAVAAHPGGDFVLVWESHLGSFDSNRDLFAQRFAQDGEALGAVLRVSQTSAFRTDAPDVATLPGGGFVVVWQDHSFLSRNLEIFARRFDADGEPLEDEILVNSLPAGDDHHPEVAVDADGDFVVAWGKEVLTIENGTVVDSRVSVFARRFEASGRPQGQELLLDPLASQIVNAPSLAADPGGSFVALWYRGQYQGPGPDGDALGIFGQRFLVPPPGADICRLEAGGLSCDVDRDGQAEARFPLPVRPGDVPLLGDLDGDGRDDPCLYRGGRFLCHTARNGSPAEVAIRFPGATDGAVPLLGDPNGDGRDDPCRFDADGFGPLLACDTAHDGGLGEVKVRLAPEVVGSPLLGDLDGDGDDEACFYRERDLLCDTAHDGGGAELAIRFGDGAAAGDVPLLGDLDGDGDDDPCVLRSGRLLCDTAHDGGAAEVDLPVGAGAAGVLLGDLDGV